MVVTRVYIIFIHSLVMVTVISSMCLREVALVAEATNLRFLSTLVDFHNYCSKQFIEKTNTLYVKPKHTVPFCFSTKGNSVTIKRWYDVIIVLLSTTPTWLLD